MRSVNLKEAKARLNELVEAAVAGEQVILMRGSRHIAAIVPITAADLELAPHLSDDQASRLWQAVAAERDAGRSLDFADPSSAVAHMQAAAGPRKRNRRASR